MKFELEPYNYGVPDNDLLTDLRRVAGKLGIKTLTQDLYNKHGRFSAAMIKKRLGWNKALEAAGLLPTKLMNISADALILDIQRVAKELGVTKLFQREYAQLGKYSGGVINRHFGDWRGAAKTAGLEHAANNYKATKDELFDNMERVWRHLGRQPVVTDMRAPLSRFSDTAYARHFGGFRKALEAFVAAVNDDSITDDVKESIQPPIPVQEITPPPKRKTQRNIGWRLSFLTLRRDGYRCRACGASPANEAGVKLEIDHVIPWSEGGETVLENLQTLCQKHNGGKSNLSWT